MVKKNIIESVKSYISLLKSEGISVDKAFIYGSQLTGDTSADSDIDVMIVTDEAGDDYTTGKIWSLTRIINAKIEPFVVSKNRFYSGDDSQLINIVKTAGLEV